MAAKEIKANYHSYLNEIKVELDPVILKMRDQKGRAWRGKAWVGPIKQYGGYLKQFKLMKTIEWSAVPIAGPGIAAFAAGKYELLPIWLCVIAGVLLAFGIYYIFVRLYENKMATIGTPEFHVEAFKAKRPTEYRVWAQFVNKNDFTFEGLYDLVNGVFSQGNSDITYVVSYSKGQLEYLQKTIADLQKTIDDQRKVITDLEADVVKSENAVTYLVGIIKKANENLYRCANQKLTLHDLDFVSGFSLYRKVDNRLELILDKGTSGKIKPLDLDADTNYVAVIAAKDVNGQAHHHSPYNERHLVAFRMLMENQETWVWCFHFDQDDERALSLILGNDIIETGQIRRLIHAFCLTIQQRMILLEGVDHNAEAN